MKQLNRPNHPIFNRRGSTLLIVLALLSLLAFTGMVFYTFAAQERSSADYFSENAKAAISVTDDPFPFALEQVLRGPQRNQKNSVLWSPRRRHSMLAGVMGYDAVPYSGSGVRVIYDSGLPVVDQDRDGTADTFSTPIENPLNLLDSMVGWVSDPIGGGSYNEQQIRIARGALPEPDVDYTYPDINNMFLAHKGWAIRDNGAAHAPASQRYERVPVFVPSFMRPSLLRSGSGNGAGGFDAVTDVDWWDHSAHPEYALRSFRPSQYHIAGLDASGTPVRRYVDALNPADLALVATVGPFPLRPGEDVNPTSFGRLGILTGHDPDRSLFPNHDPDTFRLDSDNDGDGIFEGIWIDVGYPAQQSSAGDLYATLFSFTVYDLDSLLDLNSHGNITQLDRDETVRAQVTGGGGSSEMSSTSLSASHQALGPHEVSLMWGLTPTGAAATNSAYTDPVRGFGANPVNRLEQANMEMLWMLTGRIDDTDAVWDGRWGDPAALWFHYHGADGSGGSPGTWQVNTLPRPGRAGNFDTTTNMIAFGGRNGFDDNLSALYGVASTQTGRLRGFVHPTDEGGTGRDTMLADPRIPAMLRDVTTRPDQWLQYSNYSLVGSKTSPPSTVLNELKYLSGRDQDITTPANNLVDSPRFNLGFEDPLETTTDPDFAVRPEDAIFSAADLVPAHLSVTDIGASTTNLSTRLSNLGVEAFQPGSDISRRFTTVTNSLRTIVHQHDLGPDLTAGTSDDGPRWWEWTADTDGDGRGEFPPAFGGTTFQTNSPSDPFRPVVRRLLRSEAGETRELITQLPLSINHLLDIDRASQTEPGNPPPSLLTSGLRFRRLTEHPDANEIDPDSGDTFAEIMNAANAVPLVGTTAGTTALQSFPPQTLAHREFWARRDRQMMARDIYVLLYTLGGGEVIGGTQIVNATADNSGQAVYSHNEMRRMAQFAVNLVDAMDADDVVTVFEYDKNLADGWNLDDDPYTENPGTGTGTDAETDFGLYPLDDSDRGVVFGVEAQQLSLSEALAVRMEDFGKYDGAVDDPTTLHDDVASSPPLTDPDNERKDRYILHLELQNNQPYPVSLSVNGVTGSTDGTNAVWQLARVDRDGAQTDPQSPTLDPVATPLGVNGTTMSFMDGNPDISGGGRFSVSMATAANTAATDALRNDPLSIGTADLYLQHPSGTTHELISPDEPGAAAASGMALPTPRCHLDTISVTHDGRYVYDDSVTDKGHFLREIPYPPGGTGVQYAGNIRYGFDPATSGSSTSEYTGQGFEVVLRRRQNPNAPLLPLSENPWIEVDRIRVEFKDYFTFTGSAGSYTATPHYDYLTSDERIEPLDATLTSNTSRVTPTPEDYRYNTIANVADEFEGINDATTTLNSGMFSLWQPHFDRDYTSVVELLSLPVIGPRLLTQRLERMRHSPTQQASADVTVVDADGDPNLVGSAVAMFLQPDFLPAGNDADDNAWYRLLQYVEVPSRVNEMLGNYLTRRRVPGKVNLNGLRHIEVYAGLIDDPLLADVPYNIIPSVAGSPDTHNQYAPFMNATDNPIPYSVAGARTGAGPTLVPGITTPATSYKDRWFELVSERDGSVSVHDPVQGATTTFWIPGTPSAKPFRSVGSRTPLTASGDMNKDETIFRRIREDTVTGTPNENRHWLELGTSANHTDPDTAAATTSQRERHQLLQKIYNNSTTVSNVFVIYATAAYFNAAEDPSGLIRVGSRMGLDLDGNGVETDDAGWEQRAVFVVDRTELLNAYDEGTGSFDWRRLIKYRADLASDGQ